MKRILLLGVLLVTPAFSQFGIGDAVMIAKLEAQLQQLRNIVQSAKDYKQMFNDAAAFARNPTKFRSLVGQIGEQAIRTAAATGMTTPQRIAVLQQILHMQQLAMQDAQSISVMSNQSATNLGDLAQDINSTAEELAQLNAQYAAEQRSTYYQSRSTYQPQAQIVSGWRLK